MEWYDTVRHELNSKMIHFLLLMFYAATGSGMPDKMQQDRYIIGGKNTNITEVPYQAVLFYKNIFVCGATVVSERHLLTAAHCIIRDNEKYSVRVGSSFREKYGVIHEVKKAVKHPSYSRPTVDYDVACLELESPIEFNANVQPIPVADTEPHAGDTAKISGYGKDGIGHFPAQLQSAEMLIMDRVRCNEIAVSQVTQRMTCTISKDHKTCAYKGDSGGPLVVNGKVAGATSWGKIWEPCTHPTVYSNFADPEIRRFIKENTGV